MTATQKISSATDRRSETGLLSDASGKTSQSAESSRKAGKKRKHAAGTGSVSNDPRELRLLFELSQVMASWNSGVEDISDLLHSALELMAVHLQMMRGVITLLSPKNGEIHIETAYGLNDAQVKRGHYVLGEGVTGRVIQTGKPILVPRISDSPIFLNRTRARNVRKDSIAFLCVPIIWDDQVIGALSVDRLFADSPSLEEDARLLAVIASMLARLVKKRQDFMKEREKQAAVIEENMLLRNSLSEPLRPQNFVGNSEEMQMVYEQIAQVAPSSTTVFLHGESGTGKELAAQAIHAASPRRSNPFISLNCAALPESLMESELFGHEKGAFTGAMAQRKGRFEQADTGTLFLDEVGELTLLTQAKLLRVLQERRFERVGGSQSISVDVRIITATNRDLLAMVEKGEFRRDLYYRLNVFPIQMPPLRERPNDILPLATHFIQKFAGERTGLRLSLASSDMLQRYSWPGNIRELENAMERAVLLVGRDGLILPQHLPAELHDDRCPQNTAHAAHMRFTPLQERLDELERSCMDEALSYFHGNMGKAAAALGLTERVMGLRMKKYDISYKDYRSEEAE